MPPRQTKPLNEMEAMSKRGVAGVVSVLRSSLHVTFVKILYCKQFYLSSSDIDMTV